MKNWKNDPWRLVAGVISAIYIVYMWSEKELLAIYSSMPMEEALPLIVTTVAVSVLKVVLLAAANWLAKWGYDRLKGKQSKAHPI